MTATESILAPKEIKLTEDQLSEIVTMVELHKNHFAFQILNARGLWESVEKILRHFCAVEPRSMYQNFRMNDDSVESLPALIFSSAKLAADAAADNMVVVIRRYRDCENEKRELVHVTEEGPELDLKDFHKKRYLFTSDIGELISLTIGIEMSKKQNLGDFIYLEQWGITIRASEVAEAHVEQSEKGPTVVIVRRNDRRIALGIDTTEKAEQLLSWLNHHLCARS